MTLAFDPKWGQVVALLYLESVNGEATAYNEKPGTVVYTNSVTFSTAVSRWARGAAFFPADNVSRNIQFAGIANFRTDIPQIIQGSFYPTDVVGDRLPFSFHDRLILSVDNGTLALRVRTTSAPTPVYTLTAPDIEIDQWYDYAIRLGPLGVSLALGDHVVASATWGDETHAAISPFGMLGNLAAGANASFSFRGYLGPFRWTIGDQRLEDIGVAAYRFPVLDAVDPLRERVIFHSHFDGANNQTAAVDTRGKSIVFFGNARLQSSNQKSGPTSLYAFGDRVRVSHPDFDVQGDDFCFEFFGTRPVNSGQREYEFSLMDAGGIDHALSLSSIFGHLATLRLNGADLAPIAGGGLTLGSLHYAVCRRGPWLAFFRNGSRLALYDIGSTTIASSGDFYIGKGGSAAPGGESYDYTDEWRVTRGSSRYDPESPTIAAPQGRFSVFGPRSLSGIIDDADGNPVVCKVRVYNSATGRLVSEGTTDIDGSFVLPVADIDEHFWTAHLPGKEALIGDHVLPVVIT